MQFQLIVVYHIAFLVKIQLQDIFIIYPSVLIAERGC